MQVAAFLSDLKSLSICSHEAAVALVNPPELPSTKENAKGILPHASHAETHPDPELQHANELVSLHYDVKVKFLEMGPDPELIQAERNVDQVISALHA